ncbi:MAG: cell division protein FtsZ, partial [Hyphomonas sp.]|nr:cell division protein FtsZ [Hyphomonas sp.]
INITGGYDMTLFELDEAANEVRREIDPEANIILGSAFDADLEGRIRVSVVAAGVQAGFATEAPAQPQEAAPATVRQPIAPPVEEEPELEAEPEFEAEADQDVAAEAMEPHEIDAADEDAAADGAPEDERPAIITHARTPSSAPVWAETGDADSEEGDEDVSADSVFSAQRDIPLPEKPKAEPNGPAGFSKLFGWRRPAPGENDDSPAASPAPIVSSPDDHPEPAPFDDEDLEIPAFLRRSANH